MIKLQNILYELSDAIKQKMKGQWRNSGYEGVSDDDMESYLNAFEDYRDAKDSGKRVFHTPDITKYSFDELKSIIDLNFPKAGKNTKYSNEPFDIEKANNYKEDLIYNENGLVILLGDIREKCIFYGKGQKWCISRADASNMFHSYRNSYTEKVFYFVFDKDMDEKNPYHALAVLVDTNGEYYVADADNSTNSGSRVVEWDYIVNLQPKLKKLKHLLKHIPLTDTERSDYDRFSNTVHFDKYKTFTYDDKEKYLSYGHELDFEPFKATPENLQYKYVNLGHALTDEQYNIASPKIKKRYYEVYLDALITHDKTLKMTDYQYEDMPSAFKDKILSEKLKKNWFGLQHRELEYILNNDKYDIFDKMCVKYGVINLQNFTTILKSEKWTTRLLTNPDCSLSSEAEVLLLQYPEYLRIYMDNYGGRHHDDLVIKMVDANTPEYNEMLKKYLQKQHGVPDEFVEKILNNSEMLYLVIQNNGLPAKFYDSITDISLIRKSIEHAREYPWRNTVPLSILQKYINNPELSDLIIDYTKKMMRYMNDGIKDDVFDLIFSNDSIFNSFTKDSKSFPTDSQFKKILKSKDRIIPYLKNCRAPLSKYAFTILLKKLPLLDIYLSGIGLHMEQLTPKQFKSLLKYPEFIDNAINSIEYIDLGTEKFDILAANNIELAKNYISKRGLYDDELFKNLLSKDELMKHYIDMAYKKYSSSPLSDDKFKLLVNNNPMLANYYIDKNRISSISDEEMEIIMSNKYVSTHFLKNHVNSLPSYYMDNLKKYPQAVEYYYYNKAKSQAVEMIKRAKEQVRSGDELIDKLYNLYYSLKNVSDIEYESHDMARNYLSKLSSSVAKKYKKLKDARNIS